MAISQLQEIFFHNKSEKIRANLLHPQHLHPIILTLKNNRKKHPQKSPQFPLIQADTFLPHF